MVRQIDPDSSRFKEIVRGKIRENLKQYISRGELIARQGKSIVSVPLPQIDIPTFRYGRKEQGGVGQGEGEEGTPIGADEGPPGGIGAGDQPGEHILEVDITLEELAEILGEELELRASSPRASNRSTPPRSTTREFIAPVPNRFAISSGPTSKRCAARSRREPMIRSAR